ncbi:hypothetical protein JW813_01545 [Clostridium botulinum]|uniref:hypothetical protein n=1 Tax=Clostridium botulinum TaxID=1491 RepID=UPI0022481214|nr:hypothetical protein [Clostridium botulinum]UZP03734.1 hypothetical protein JW813_01545 [Clostridium botulinum]UZP07090.1 hypothetical protein JYA71_01540 [Clostridium botulinum]UZP10472.1 hypothetical protein JYA74_01540 [Clostridium botulinum]
METVLQATLASVGTKIVGELTWNIIKSSSSKIIDSFKKKFMQKYDTNEERCVNFLEDISTIKSNNTKRPFKEVMSLFEKHVDKDCLSDFEADFKQWLIENSEEFAKLKNNELLQNSSIVINGDQYADRGGSIQFIANQYNNIAEARR